MNVSRKNEKKQTMSVVCVYGGLVLNYGTAVKEWPGHAKLDMKWRHGNTGRNRNVPSNGYIQRSHLRAG